jgi:ketosteroid isomerase-like protein
MVTLPLSRRQLMAAAGALTCGAAAAVAGMGDAVAATESEVRKLFDRRSEAFRTKDIEAVMSIYSPDIVYFDLVPPLRYAGSAALRARFLDWFGRWQSAIGQDLRDVIVVASGDVAAAHMLIRTSGTLKDGRQVGYWVRTSNACQRSKHRWLITHEHVSLPVDMKAGRGVMDLVP